METYQLLESCALDPLFTTSGIPNISGAVFHPAPQQHLAYFTSPSSGHMVEQLVRGNEGLQSKQQQSFQYPPSYNGWVQLKGSVAFYVNILQYACFGNSDINETQTHWDVRIIVVSIN